MWEYLGEHPTLPILVVSGVIAFLSWRSQQKLARAKNSIDLQNNFLASERIHNKMVFVASLRTRESDWISQLAAVSNLENASAQQCEAIKSIRTVLNAFERIAIGIDSKIYDERLIFRSYRGFVIDTYKNLQPYIMSKREGRYYNHYCAMAERWMRWDKEGLEPPNHSNPIKSFVRCIKDWINKC